MAYYADIFQNNDFTGFTASIMEAVHIAIEKFWEQDVKLKIRAMNTFRELRDEKLIKGVDFFSSQIKVEQHKPVTIRLDSDFIENFFDITLDDESDTYKKKNFKLSSMSNLEIKILNSFCEFLYKKIKDILIPVSTVKLSDKSEKKLNILFYVVTKNLTGSNIMLTIPQDRVQLSELKKCESFYDEDFVNQSTFVKVQIGTSKIRLSELKNLEEGDIVLLEDSDIKKATLISGDFKKKFNIRPNPSLIINLGDDEEDTQEQQINQEVIMEKNLWDDIQVEINAEFAKVKMTIGELKQITKGQIVDLGSVFENELSLFVENKQVAKGKLVINNDRYAVRLNEDMSSEVKKQMPEQKTQEIKKEPAKNPPPKQLQQTQARPQPQQKPQQPQQTQKVQDEEFDYSDFEK